MRILSTAPCRVDLAGGTLDIWPLYLFHDSSVTVNFAVNRYASCRLETRTGRRIVLRSLDLGLEESFDSMDDLTRAKRYRLPIAALQLRHFRPAMGLQVETHSEAPAGAGIAGSSALGIAICAALNRLMGTRHNLERIREISQNIEAQVIRVPTGCQDYYPALYGGVSAIEMGAAGIVRKAILVDPDELGRRTVLAYTGEPRHSGINNWEAVKAHMEGDRRVYRHVDEVARIAGEMRVALEAGDWMETGRLLHREWSHRRQFAPTISTPLIDRMVRVARRAGALGAKVCGAGGGGCVFFLVEPEARAAVSGLLEREGAQVLPVRVARGGVRVRVALRR